MLRRSRLLVFYTLYSHPPSRMTLNAVTVSPVCQCNAERSHSVDGLTLLGRNRHTNHPPLTFFALLLFAGHIRDLFVEEATPLQSSWATVLAATMACPCPTKQNKKCRGP
jgi:hypothetical protein